MTQPQLSTVLDKIHNQNRLITTEMLNDQSPQVLHQSKGEEMNHHLRIMNKRASEQELSIEKLKELYLETLTPKEHKSYNIARDHLGMSFTLEKSVGFLQWKSNI